MKFTGREANAISPFIGHSSIMSWLHSIFGRHGASYVIGVMGLSTAVALIAGAFNPLASALGAALSSLIYVVTLTFFPSTPDAAQQALGFPGISAPIGQLLKDLVLLGRPYACRWRRYHRIKLGRRCDRSGTRGR